MVDFEEAEQQGLRKTKDKLGFGNDLIKRDRFPERVLYSIGRCHPEEQDAQGKGEEQGNGVGHGGSYIVGSWEW